MKLAEIAEAIGGDLVGDGGIEIAGVAHPAEAMGNGDLVLAMDDKLLALLADSNARAAIVMSDAEVPEGAVDGYIRVGRAKVAMAGVSEIFDLPMHREPGIDASAAVDPSARIGNDISIGPFVYVGPNAEIGDGAVLMPHVTIGAGAKIGAGGLLHSGARVGERVTIGKGVIMHHNASVGSDGFSFATPEPGSVEGTKGSVHSTVVSAQNLILRRINSLGSVIIGDYVEIGASSTIDRGTVSNTSVGDHTKIDNLVQIGHNVTIGSNCMICGQVGIAGSVEIGDRVVLAGKVGVADHITIGSDSVVGGGSGVGMDVPPKTVVIGYPAIPKDQMAEQYMNVRRLSSAYKDIRKLKDRLKALENESEKG
jgi:UDP-3-O-[3-hydroxymyristoyl] glucosamine N-acyltransferase